MGSLSIRDLVPVNKELLTGTVPVNKELLTGTVPVGGWLGGLVGGGGSTMYIE